MGLDLNPLQSYSRKITEVFDNSNRPVQKIFSNNAMEMKNAVNNKTASLAELKADFSVLSSLVMSAFEDKSDEVKRISSKNDDLRRRLQELESSATCPSLSVYIVSSQIREELTQLRNPM